MRLAALALFASIALTGCAAPPVDDPAYLRVAITSSPRDLDPRIGVDEVSQRVHQLVFSPLLKLDSELSLIHI